MYCWIGVISDGASLDLIFERQIAGRTRRSIWSFWLVHHLVKERRSPQVNRLSAISGHYFWGKAYRDQAVQVMGRITFRSRFFPSANYCFYRGLGFSLGLWVFEGRKVWADSGLPRPGCHAVSALFGGILFRWTYTPVGIVPSLSYKRRGHKSAEYEDSSFQSYHPEDSRN